MNEPLSWRWSMTDWSDWCRLLVWLLRRSHHFFDTMHLCDLCCGESADVVVVLPRDDEQTTGNAPAMEHLTAELPRWWQSRDSGSTSGLEISHPSAVNVKYNADITCFLCNACIVIHPMYYCSLCFWKIAWNYNLIHNFSKVREMIPRNVFSKTTRLMRNPNVCEMWLDVY